MPRLRPAGQRAQRLERGCDVPDRRRSWPRGPLPLRHHRHPPPRPDLEKTALGAQRTVPWDYWPRTGDALVHLRRRGVLLVALECADDAVSMERAASRYPLCFLVGNEVTGLADEVRARCDHTAMIPMHGDKESLNVAVSFGLMAYASRRCWELATAPSSRRE